MGHKRRVWKKNKKKKDGTPADLPFGGKGEPVMPTAADEAAFAGDVPGVAIKDFVYARRDRDSYSRIATHFPNERDRWISALAYDNHDALRQYGFTNKQIRQMRRGEVPQDYSVHHIKPKDDGGDNSWSNFVLIKRSPAHDRVHEFLDPQLTGLHVGDRRTVRFPDLQPGVYPPVPGLKLPLDPKAVVPVTAEARARNKSIIEMHF